MSESLDLRNVKHLFWLVVGPNVWDRGCLVSKAVNGLIGTLRVVRRLNPVRGPRGQPTAVPNDRSRHQPFRNSPRASSHFFLMIRFSRLQLLESARLPQLEKSHITESRYDISWAFSAPILTSSHADTLIRNGAAPRDRTGRDVVLQATGFSQLPRAAWWAGPGEWRRGWDSNPRSLSTRRFSRPLQ